MVLVYAADQIEDLAYGAELDDLARHLPLHLVRVLRDPRPEWDGEQRPSSRPCRPTCWSQTSVGWLLRELARRRPDVVTGFLASHRELSTEARRNALKRGQTVAK